MLRLNRGAQILNELKKFKRSILVTGGAGFIGSHVVRLMVNKYPQYKIINLDNLTYAGNLENLQDVEDKDNYKFIKGDIKNKELINQLFKTHNINAVINLAAESHVDRSITNPIEFLETNVIGTGILLNAANNFWQDNKSDKLFYHVSTDEVFGSLGSEGLFSESTSYDPRSPYSASKASSDHLVRAYHHTYNLPILISNCSNNYGPNQFPEKLIPLMINNIINHKPLPVYGKGANIRDWLYVEDHAKAIDMIYHKGQRGETYCIGGNNEWKNIDIVKLLCEKCDEKLGRQNDSSKELIEYVTDRKGHDFRYAIDNRKMEKELGWKPKETFESGIDKTINWYLNNEKWLKSVTTGAYQKYYQNMYHKESAN